MTERPWDRSALVQLSLLRLREFIREPEALFWALAFPILLSTGLGIAFRAQPAELLRVAATSDALAASMAQDPQLSAESMPVESARDALRTGAVLLVVEPGAGEGVVYHYDDTNPDGRLARLLADRAIQRAAGRVDPVAARDDVLRETGSRYIDFLIPGLVGMGIMANALWGIGFSIVDARRRKLMKRIVATPMPRHLFLLSFLIWRMALLVVEVGVPVAFGAIAFGVPVRGPIAQLVGICVLGSLAFSAIGVLIASRARTIEGVSGLMNFVMVPMWILSGVFFSTQRFPDFLQPVIAALPLSALVTSIRATMLQGTGLDALGSQLGVIGVWFVASFALAMKLFRWR